MVGTLLKDRYRIEVTLGEGGMGVVYRAHDTLLDRSVAIKTLSSQVLGDEGVKRLLREARAAAGLTHPNIVAIYDVVEDTGSYAIVMELIHGHTFKARSPLPLEQLAEETVQILDALEHAHSKGIVHRDIKPENIMVTEGGTVKVMDFGLARSEGRSRLTQTGLIVGTVAYMAPEQALGGELDGRTDLYALGCVLYEAVTGHRPFESEDPISVISQHLSVPPVAPRWHNKELPPDWEGAILKLMAKDPAERYASAAEARRAFQALRPAKIGEMGVAEGEAPSASLVGTVQRGRLVGRDAELRDLKGHIDLAISGQGQMVTVAGEPGIGKTRIAREGLIYGRLRGCRVMGGACYEQEGGVPYLPFVEALQDYVKTRSSDQLSVEVGEQGPELVKILPELAEAMPGLTPSSPLEPTHERLRLYAGVTDFLIGLSRSAPLLLFLDDLHWADGATLQLLKHIARQLRGERLLILGTYRDVELDRQHPLADTLREMNRERLYQRLILHRLDPQGVGAMIAAMFGIEHVSEEFATLVHRETEGNPFFVEEVLKHLIETGALYREQGRWQRKEIREIEIPQSVKEVIGRRLEQVSEACQQTLTLASVIGKRFSFDVLVRMDDRTEDEVLNAIEEAIKSQLLSEEKVGGVILYDFAHALIKETLYEGLSLRRRMRLHQRVGEALEAVYHVNTDAVVEDLAFHFARSPQAEVGKAVAYALVAAEKAQRIYAHEEAMKFLGEALELLKEAGREADAADVLERMGEPTWMATGDYHKGVAYLQQALAYREKVGDRLGAAGVHRKIGRIYHLSAAFGQAIPHLQTALQISEAEGKPEDVARTLVNLARARQFTGDFEGAERDATRAREVAVTQGMRVEEAMASAELALCLSHKGRDEEANALYRVAIKLCEGIESSDCSHVRRRSYHNMALTAMVRGDFNGSRELFSRALNIAVSERNYPWMAFVRDVMIVRDLFVGDWESARQHVQAILDPKHYPGVRLMQAATRLHRWIEGDWEGIVELLGQELADAERERDLQEQLGVLRELIEVSVDLEDHEGMIRWARQAREVHRPYQQYPRFGGGIWLAIPLALGLGGDLSGAQESLSLAERRTKLFEAPFARANNSMVRAVIEAKSDAWGQAIASFGQGATDLQNLGAFGRATWGRWIFGRLLLADPVPERHKLGRKVLGEALQSYEHMGATRYVQEIRKRLEPEEGTTR